MRHGYTNSTVRHRNTVRKSYQGPDTDARRAAELQALTALASEFPVPRVVGHDRQSLTTTYVKGEHGQDLMQAGHAGAVLAECGRTLRRLHALDPRLIDDRAVEGSVIVHGDFGPNNVLFETGPLSAAAVLDWEFSALGRPLIDVAWCEWIVRMHHPEDVGELPAFFAAYGAKPSWEARQIEMVRRCRWLEDFSKRWDADGPGVALWQERVRTVQGWVE